MTDGPLEADAGASDDRGWCLYGITRSGGMTAAELNDALSDEPVTASLSAWPLERVEMGALAAIVQSVALAEFDADALQARSDDEAWLAAIVGEHNRVIAHVHERQAILPARFGSIYPGIQEVRQALEVAQDDLVGQLDRLEDCDEWAVHIFANRTQLRGDGSAGPAIRRLEEEMATARPGRAYFLKRKLEEERSAASERALRTLAERTFDELSGLAVASQISPIQRRAQPLSGGVEIVRAAFLVSRAGLEAFYAALLGLQSRDGVHVESTGPWPPYSFVALPENDR